MRRAGTGGRPEKGSPTLTGERTTFRETKRPEEKEEGFRDTQDLRVDGEGSSAYRNPS